MIDCSLVAHCDWSREPRKRWMVVATRKGETWHVSPPEPAPQGHALLSDLRARAGDGGIVAGFDFPIGLPAAYGSKTGLADFRDALRQFGAGAWDAWYDVCNLSSEISIHRPFYPSRPGGRSQAHLFAALDLPREALLRWCEYGTPERRAACMLFWTLGGNQVGKAAIAGWREVIVPSLGNIGLWPFDGSLGGLLQRCGTAVTETYPGEVYRHLGILPSQRWSKRSRDGRRSVARSLLTWMDSRAIYAPELAELIASGFDTGLVGEDQFDAAVGLFGMLDVVERRRPEGFPVDRWIRQWEGWILGQVHPIASGQLPGAAGGS